MMAKSLDYWRGYFGGANGDICDIIENAIVVAALDHPKDFKLRRDHIAELLFTCKLTKCFGCDGVELSVPKKGCDGMASGEFEEERERSKGDKVDCFEGDDAKVVCYKEVEALSDEIEDESKFIAEVFRIKEVLDNRVEESDSTLLDSLRRLQLMDLSVEILNATEIGKSVNGLKKHGSKQIRDIVRTLVEGWIALLDTWMIATAAIAENTSPESMKTSTVDFEEGLPSPPLEEGAFLTHTIELSEFFDGMDDDGNLRNNVDVNNNRGSGRKPPVKDGSLSNRKQQLSDDLFAPLEKKLQPTMKEETVLKKRAAVLKPNKPSNEVTGNMRPTRTSSEQKFDNETKFQPKKDERAVQKEEPVAPQDDVCPKQRVQQSANGAIRKKPSTVQQEKMRSPDQASMQMKIEATKRKLHERYQEAEKAKKQRTIQVLEDIPKQGAGRNHLMKPGHHNHNRHWANGRR